MTAEPPGLVLAIDSAGSRAGLALTEAGALLAERYPEGAARNNEELGAALVALFEEAGRQAAELRGIGVSLGPGSYTGLRVGLALARGLALMDRLPVAGIGSLELLLLSAPADMLRPGPVLAATDAGGGRAYLGRFTCPPGGQAAEVPAAEPELVDKAALAGLAGDAVLLADQGLAAELGQGVAGAVSEERAGRLAGWAAADLAAGRGAEAATVMPLYAGPVGARPNNARVGVSS